MRLPAICCLLMGGLIGGCATSPSDLVGGPLDEAISTYGRPKDAVDFEGARSFYFEPDSDDDTKKNKLKKLLDPNMAITGTKFKSSKCVYTMNALWTSAREEWVIHSANASPQCEGSND